MLRWALIFLIIALVAALFGFTGIAAAAAGIAKFLFFLFLVVCLIFFVTAFPRAEEFHRAIPRFRWRYARARRQRNANCMVKQLSSRARLWCCLELIDELAWVEGALDGPAMEIQTCGPYRL